MMTPEQSAKYKKWMDDGKLDAIKTGNEIAALIKSKVPREKGEDYYSAPGISNIWLPLLLEPILSELDHGYDTLGQCNFQWLIDLYVGRKCAKIIPLLIEQAKRLHEKGHVSKETAMKGGGSDHYYWANFSTRNYISMRWDTQSVSYYITLSCDNPDIQNWTLNVAETGLGKKRAKTKNNWEKEPGHVLDYSAEPKWSNIGVEMNNIDKNEVKNAWANLVPIARWMSLINTVCCTLDINLYSPPYENA